jgi:RNA polymerase sigma-70 factor, ECF subfamily
MTTGQVMGDEGSSLSREVRELRKAPEALASALARRLRKRVLRIASALLRHAADAEDAAQVALMEIVKAAPSFRGESSLEAWADRIAVRTSMRFARKRRLVTVKNDSSVEPDELHAPAAADWGDELPRSIHAYLDELPEARRTVLVLRHAMGYSVDEIAELTGVSVNTVKDRLLQSREQVRRMVRRELAVRGRRS